MSNSLNVQKKKVVLSYIYATIVSLLIIACVTTIALINKSSTKPTANVNIEQTVPVSTTSYVVPMKNAIIQKDFSSSELQYNDTMKQWEIHKAIDFQATDDVNVSAVADGTVSNVYNNYLEGTVIEISHSNNMVTIYKSLAQDVNVKIGDRVTAGTVIGKASNTMAQELNSGEHLHFEVIVNGIKVDPNNYISLGDK